MRFRFFVRALTLATMLCLLAATTASAQDLDPAPAEPAAPDTTGDVPAGPDNAGQQGTNPLEPAGDQGPNPVPDNSGDPGEDQAEGQGDDAGEEGEPVVVEPPPPPPCPPGLINAASDGQPVRCVDPEELTRLLAEYEAAAAEEAEALVDLAEILGELDTLNEQLDAMETDVGAAQLQVAAATVDAGYAALRTSATADLLTEAEGELVSEEQLLVDQAVAAYVGGGELEAGLVNVVLDAETLSDVKIAQEYSSAVMSDQSFSIERASALRAEVEELTILVAEVQSLADAEIGRVAELEARLQQLVRVQEELVEATETNATGTAEIIAGIQAEKQSFADQLEINAAGGGEIGDMLRARQFGQEPPEVLSGLFKIPLDPVELGSGYGPRVHPIFADTRMHTGMDMSAPMGQPILASADGVVVMAEAVGGYGNLVVIDHGNGLATLYAHQTADAVFVGQEVFTGDIIGFVGSTGYSTGPHVHFEVRLFGTPVDPLPYLDLLDQVDAEGNALHEVLGIEPPLDSEVAIPVGDDAPE